MMTHVRFAFMLAGALSALPAAPAAAPAAQGREHTETVTRAFTVGPTGALDVANLAGDVRVTGGTGSEIRIQAVKRVRHADPAEARRLLGALRLDMAAVGRRVEVRTEYPRGERRVAVQVDYTIAVPSGTAVAVRSVSGRVHFDSLAGEARAESVSGDVEILDCRNLAAAKTVSGRIDVRNAASSGSMTLGTVSGSIAATGLRAPSLDASTVSGSVQLDGLQVERLQARSVSGTIEFAGTLSRSGRYEFTSHSGDVRLRLSGAVGFDLEASSFGGSIRSDFPLTFRSATGRRERSGPLRTVRGSYGDAAAVISARSFSGSIVIVRP